MKPTTDGSYHCSCGAGYENVNSTHIGTALDGTECQNINECTTGDNECDVNAHCTDSVGGYTCECLGGWTGDGRTCMDYEECKNMMERNVSHTGTEWIDGNTYGGARGLTLMSNYTFQDCHEYAYCEGQGSKMVLRFKARGKSKNNFGALLKVTKMVCSHVIVSLV